MPKVVTVTLEIQVRVDDSSPDALSLDDVECNLRGRLTAFLYPAGMTVLSARGVPSERDRGAK